MHPSDLAAPDFVSAAHDCTREEFAAQHGGFYLVPAPQADRARTQAKTFSHRQALAQQVTEAIVDGEALTVRVLPLRPSARTRNGPIHVGRTEDNDVVVPSLTVSRRHAAFVLTADRVEVVDLGSRNGTRVRGIALRPGESLSVKSGDSIDLGSVRLVLVDAANCWTALREP